MEIQYLHPNWDIELEPGQGSIDEGLKSFVKQCVQSPLTNQQRKKALEKSTPKCLRAQTS